MQWNPPTFVELRAGETAEYGLQFSIAAGGPRTRDDQLAKLGRAVVKAVPGYVVSSDMQSAKLFVKPPSRATISSTSVEPAGILSISPPSDRSSASGYVAMAVSATGWGACRASITFSDGSELAIHYFAIGRSLSDHVDQYGAFMANTAWLPVDYPDPFNRGASMVPWDRERKRHILQDGRTFVVGLSDDAGGGNHLGFASKVGIGGSPNSKRCRASMTTSGILYTVRSQTRTPGLPSRTSSCRNKRPTASS